MNIGFTGTRSGMTDVQAVLFEGLIEQCESFHHGSCQGADVEAARIVARTFQNPPRIVCHPGPDGDSHRAESGVDDEVREPKTHFARNRNIVDETDMLIGCPSVNEWQTRGGTFYTMDYAIKKGKRVTVIWPDGRIQEK